VAKVNLGIFSPRTNIPLFIGIRPPSGPHFANRFLGRIDEVEVYNRALSPEEVQAIFSAGSAGKCKTISAAIDIKPGSFPNSINLGSGGTVPVAILSSITFDAMKVDPLTVTLTSAPVQLADVEAFFTQAAANYPKLYQNRTFQDWLGFLTSQVLVLVNENGVSITVRGHECHRQQHDRAVPRPHVGRPARRCRTRRNTLSVLCPRQPHRRWRERSRG
jgi:hypothetical protein